MPKVREWEYEVEGIGAFPTDMLRYDRARFATPADEQVANNTRGGKRHVKLRGYEAPTHGRWASFMWHVIDEHQL